MNNELKSLKRKRHLHEMSHDTKNSTMHISSFFHKGSIALPKEFIHELVGTLFLKTEFVQCKQTGHEGTQMM